MLTLYLFCCSCSYVLCANLGKWGDTNLTFQMVPVSVALSPTTNELVLWATETPVLFKGGTNLQTFAATYNLLTKEIKNMTVTNTKHDMVCPGISLLFDGRIFVAGGGTAPKTSIYNGSWTSSSDLNIPRGYQSTATTSDGKVFTIGGSWNGNNSEWKDGELWDPKTGNWSRLPGCLVKPMLTKDNNGKDPENYTSFYFSDNHAWLFSWSNGSVFQAGPSSAMNWYFTDGNGSMTSAGLRLEDGDRMCGNAVMYDAVAGNIFTAGGAPSYTNSTATNNTYVIIITQPGEAPCVRKTQSMTYSRELANSVVLPDGKIFIVGGVSYGTLLSDKYAVMVPEMWDPETETFTDMAKIPEARTYHSVALLMPDATVFSGGGGLGGECNCNHLDGQFYSPPYLFKEDGETTAARPEIQNVTTEVKVGGTIKATVKSVGNGKMAFSFIRVGSTTHTANTDQRRVSLTTNSTASPFEITLPSDPGVLLPGYWMLFVLESGVPSVSKFVMVTL